jgi:hypothetical protein
MKTVLSSILMAIADSLPESYCMVILGPAPAPDDVQSCSLAANRTATPLYTIATSLEGEAATIGLPASDVSRIAMFRGTCHQAIAACSDDPEKSEIATPPCCIILWVGLIDHHACSCALSKCTTHGENVEHGDCWVPLQETPYPSPVLLTEHHRGQKHHTIHHT